MDIRRATMEDLERLRPLYDGQLRYMAVCQPRQYRAVRQDGTFIQSEIEAEQGCVLLAEENGAVMGFVSVTVEDTGEKAYRVPQRYAVLENIYVREECRRTGVGTALFRAAWDWARAGGAGSMQLMTLAENTRAQQFYRSMGMRFLQHVYTLEEEAG